MDDKGVILKDVLDRSVLRNVTYVRKWIYLGVKTAFQDFVKIFFFLERENIYWTLPRRNEE